MALNCDTETHPRTFRFDGTLLKLGPEEEAFFKAETGIQDPEELRRHVIEVYEEAYKVKVTRLVVCQPVDNAVLCVQVYPYPCIRASASGRVRISEAFLYLHVLELVKSRPDAIFLDIGCCCMNQFISRSCLPQPDLRFRS